MASTTTPFYIINQSLQPTSANAPLFPIDKTGDVYAGDASAIQVSRGNYIEIEHDAFDGVSTVAENWTLFRQLYVDTVGAQVDAVLDNGSGTNMPASNPDRLSVLYFLDTSSGMPATYKLRLRWGNLNNYKKEFLWKRIYRGVMLQQRDNDAGETMLLSASGIWEWINTAIPAGAGPPTSGIPAMIVDQTDFLPAARTNTSFSLSFNAVAGSPTLSSTEMRDVFDDFIVHRTAGRIDPSTLSWITDDGGTAPMVLTFSIGSTPVDLTRAVTAMEIVNLVASEPVYSIYDRLAFEIADDVMEAGGFTTPLLSANNTTISHNI